MMNEKTWCSNEGTLLVTCYIWAGWMIDEVMVIREIGKEALDIDFRTFILYFRFLRRTEKNKI